MTLFLKLVVGSCSNFNIRDFKSSNKMRKQECGDHFEVVIRYGNDSP